MIKNHDRGSGVYLIPPQNSSMYYTGQPTDSHSKPDVVSDGFCSTFYFTRPVVLFITKLRFPPRKSLTYIILGRYLFTRVLSYSIPEFLYVPSRTAD